MTGKLEGLAKPGPLCQEHPEKSECIFLDGLCAIVYDQITLEPSGHSVYLFCGKHCDRIKVLFHEPDGYVLLLE